MIIKHIKSLMYYTMWHLRMLGLKTIVYRPTQTEGVGTSHLKLIWARGFKLAF